MRVGRATGRRSLQPFESPHARFYGGVPQDRFLDPAEFLALAHGGRPFLAALDPVLEPVTVAANAQQVRHQLGAQALVGQVVKMTASGTAGAALRATARSVEPPDFLPVLAREVFRVFGETETTEADPDAARVRPVGLPLRAPRHGVLCSWVSAPAEYSPHSGRILPHLPVSNAPAIVGALSLTSAAPLSERRADQRSSAVESTPSRAAVVLTLLLDHSRFALPAKNALLLRVACPERRVRIPASAVGEPARVFPLADPGVDAIDGLRVTTRLVPDNALLERTWRWPVFAGPPTVDPAVTRR